LGDEVLRRQRLPADTAEAGRAIDESSHFDSKSFNKAASATADGKVRQLTFLISEYGLMEPL
jgi:hypothetical protein